MSGCVQVQKCGPFPRRRTFWVCTLACAPSLGFFSSSLLVVVCLGKKKKERFSSSTAAVDCCLPPLPRSSCSTYATRPRLPAAKQRSARPPPLTPPFFIPQWCFETPSFKTTPHREHTPQLFKSCGDGGGVGAWSDSRGGGLLKLYSDALMFHSYLF